MKNDYNKKKRIAITTLSVAAICLAGSLFWYMGTLGNTQAPVAQTESQPEPEPTITVPAIKPESTSEPVTSPAETEPETTPEPETTTAPETTKVPEATEEPETASAAVTVTQDVKTKPSAGKPKTPDEATPPEEPPKEESTSAAPIENPDESGQCQPEHTPQSEADQPQGGESRSDGAVYVPGFGWVPYEGENSTETAPNAGTGKPVGEM